MAPLSTKLRQARQGSADKDLFVLRPLPFGKCREEGKKIGAGSEVWALGAGLFGYFGKCLGKSWRFWFGLGDLVSSCFELNLRQVAGLSVWWVSAKWLRHGSPRAGS
ncbi:unnamed protein product [Prunus armeniaca]